MYAKLVTTSAPTQAAVISDIAKLCSGSDIASLSSSADKTNSVLISTVAPGWTLIDSAAPSSGQVLSAPDADGVTTKIINLYAPATTTISLFAYTAWNSTAHTGTDVSTNPGTMAFTAGAVNTFYIFATPRTIFVLSANTLLYAAEFTREAAYLVGSTYQPFMIGIMGSIVSSGTSYTARRKALTVAGDYTAANAQMVVMQMAARVQSGVAQGPFSAVQDAAGNLYHEIRPIYAGIFGPESTQSGTNLYCGKLYDVYETSRNGIASYDTISDGTNTYMAYASGATCLLWKMA